MKRTFRTLAGSLTVEVDEQSLRVRAGRERAEVPLAAVISATVSARGLTNSLGVWGGHNLNLVGAGGVLASIRVPSRRVAQKAAVWINREGLGMKPATSYVLDQRSGVFYSSDGRWWWDGQSWRPVA